MKPMIPYSKLTKAATHRKEFSESWKELAEAGTGSMVAVRRVRKMLIASRWHRRRMNEVVLEIAKRSAKWADDPMDEEHLDDFLGFLRNKLADVSACQIVIGAMVGIGSISGVGAEPILDAEE